MIDAISNLQAPLVASILLLAAVGKVDVARRGRPLDALDQPALGALPDAAVRAAWLMIVFFELGVVVVLVALPSSPWPPFLASSFLAGGAAYAVWSRRVAPDSPCGCFGSFSRAPVSWKTIARASLLAAAALAAGLATGGWADTRGNLWLWLLLVGELGTLAYLSPELYGLWRWFVVGRKAPRCANSEQRLEASLQELRRSSLWAQLRDNLLQPDYADSWRDGCWRFFSFPTRHSGEFATAIFAVRLPPGRHAYKGAIVRDSDGTVLLQQGESWRWSPPRRLVAWLAFGAAAVAVLAAAAAAAQPSFPPSIYPTPASFPNWGAASGCPSLAGTEAPTGGVTAAVLTTLSQFGTVSENRDLHLSDRALWPVVRETWRVGTRPAPLRRVQRSDVVAASATRSPYAALIRKNCGSATSRRSLWVALCPKSSRRCRLQNEPARIEHFLLLERRSHWLIWWMHP
jgi:hypothetical protein